jgi:MFS family permease
MPPRPAILFWQLLIATIAINIVVCKWTLDSSLDRVEQIYYGLACGQVSVAAIGAFFATRFGSWRWLVPLGAIALATFLTTWVSYEEFFTIIEFAAIHITLWLTQSLGVLAGLWILEHTKLADQWRSPTATRRVQFAIKHLLIAMTLLAAILVSVRLARFESLLLVLIVFACNNVGIAIFAVICHILSGHFVLRWAAYAAVVTAMTYIVVFLAGGGVATGINSYQALVLFLWLTIGGIGPKRTSDVVAESAAPPPLEPST